MHNVLLSVIVPVYNVEKYLGECLDSLVNQSFNDMEIIVVNDGTKDNSQAIIDGYVKKYPKKITSLIKENGGLSDARNYGLSYAKGKYLTFIDSDDYIEEDLYERMIGQAETNNADLVVGDIEYFFENSEKEKYTLKGLKRVSDNNIRNLFLSPLFAWNKIYKRELFEKLNCRYPVGLWYEDIPVSLKYFANINKVSYVEGPAYHYRQRGDSILGTKYSDKMYDIFKEFDSIIQEFKEINKFDEFHDEIEYLAIENFLLYGAFRFLRTEHYKELMNKSFEYIEKEFPNYRKNIYLKTLSLKNRVFVLSDNKLTMNLWHWYLTK